MKPSTRRVADLAVEVLADPRERREVRVHDLLRLVGRDVEPLREPPRVHPVGEAVVHHLGAATASPGSTASSGRSNTVAAVAVWMSSPLANAARSPSSPERCARIAQLDLRVVGDEEHLVGLARDERPADLASELGADRDVLQVRVRRREPPGRRRGLLERRVHPAVARIDEPRERLEVGRVQLVELAPLKQRVDDRVRVAQLLEHAGVGRQLTLGRLLARLQAELRRTGSSAAAAASSG